MSSGVRQGSRPRRSTMWTGKKLSLAPSSSSGLSMLSTSVILFATHIEIKVFFSTAGTLSSQNSLTGIPSPINPSNILLRSSLAVLLAF